MLSTDCVVLTNILNHSCIGMAVRIWPDRSAAIIISSHCAYHSTRPKVRALAVRARSRKHCIGARGGSRSSTTSGWRNVTGAMRARVILTHYFSESASGGVTRIWRRSARRDDSGQVGTLLPPSRMLITANNHCEQTVDGSRIRVTIGVDLVESDRS
jgi:hypothetical protein